MPHLWEARLRHDRLGRETLRTMTGGVACAMQYDGVGRPSRQSVTRGGHSLYNRGYRWDDDFRLSHAHDAISGRIARYFYDDFGSLAEAEYGDGVHQWRNPDIMGNVYDSADRTDRTYARGGQLREDRRWRYHYDKQGNLVLKTKRKISPIAETPQGNRKRVFGLFSGSNTSKEGREQEELIAWQPGDYAYTWLPNGMLGSVTRPDGKVVTFKYDALGRRIEKSFNGRVHRYLWDGDVVLHEWEYAETDRPQPTVAENGEVSFDRPEPTNNLVTWVYDTDSYVPTAKLVGGKRYGIVSDYIGRPVQAYDEHGTLVWQADYDIYGNLFNLRGDRQFVPFRQLGQYEDEETGLYYNRFRYYDPNTGGYISQDPIGLAGNNPTLYGYVENMNVDIDILGLHIANAVYTNTNGINGEVGSFASQKGGFHSEPQILNQLGNQKGGHLEITSMDPKGDGKVSFFKGPSGKSFPAGPLPPCGPKSKNCDALLYNHAKNHGMTITYKWNDMHGNSNVRVYSPDGTVMENGRDISCKYCK